MAGGGRGGSSTDDGSGEANALRLEAARAALEAARAEAADAKAALSTRTIPLREVNWLGDAPLDSQPEWHLRVKVRSTRPPAPAILRPISATEAEVELLAPEEGVSPGQACVFYETGGSRILGGGWIWKGR